MTVQGQVRWGIIGTANIARAVFLPGLRQAGGDASAVAGRDAGRAAQFARDNGIGRSVQGYQNLIDDPAVDALYIPLPNSLHAEWTIRALEAGKPVLCEKPLCGTLADTERVLAAARRTGTLLWEAFSFPFHAQFRRLKGLVADGAIGELMEIKSNFHFSLTRPENIRYSRDLQGGALLDVGCYPVRLAAELLGPAHESSWALARRGGHDVDVDTWAVLNYPAGRRLLLSCGFVPSGAPRQLPALRRASGAEPFSRRPRRAVVHGDNPPHQCRAPRRAGAQTAGHRYGAEHRAGSARSGGVGRAATLRGTLQWQNSR